MLALSPVSPLYFSSCASSLRADRLLSRSSTFMRSTIEWRQSSFSFFWAARPASTAATSTGCPEPADPVLAPVASPDEAVLCAGAADPEACVGAAVVCEVVADVGAAGVGCAACAWPDLPNMPLMMFPKTLIIRLLG